VKVGVVCTIYITTQQQFDQFETSMASFKSPYELEYVAIVNRCDEPFKDRVLKRFANIIYNDVNCLSKAWNNGIKFFEGRADYILIPNLDVRCDNNTIRRLVDFAQAHKDIQVFSSYAINGTHHKEATDGYYLVDHVTAWDNYSFFMLRTTTCSDLYKLEPDGVPFRGYFDENIRPAYCEDIDFQYRLELAGVKHACVAQSLYFHYGQVTIRNHEDPAWAQKNLSQSASESYVIQKWGGMREGMVYTKPFDRQ
jgi:GT2 family glycosyltransferase